MGQMGRFDPQEAKLCEIVGLRSSVQNSLSELYQHLKSLEATRSIGALTDLVETFGIEIDRKILEAYGEAHA